MKARRARLALGAILTVCITLGVMLARARTRADRLEAEISRIQQTPTPTLVPSRVDQSPTAAQAASRTSPSPPRYDALLAEALQIPELARYYAALQAIRNIQAEHRASPPPPLPLPPPRPRNAANFRSLMSDPEYARLVQKSYLSTYGELLGEQLERKGVPEEARREIVQLHLDNYLTQVQMGPPEAQTSGSGGGVPREVYREMIAENTTRIQSLMGGAASAPNSLVDPGFMADHAVSTLATRLSYSSKPLSDTDASYIHSLLLAASSPDTPPSSVLLSSVFLEQTRDLLEPVHWEGLRQLHEEREARDLRRQLPESSQLPRTIRRDRREGMESVSP